MWSYKNCRHPSIHIMMTSSNGSIFRVTGSLGGEFVVTGEFPSQKPVTRSFDVFFDLHLNKRLRKQSRRRWFEGVVRFPFDGLAHNAGFHFTTSQIDFSKIVNSFTIVNWENLLSKMIYDFEEYFYRRRWHIAKTHSGALPMGNILFQKKEYHPLVSATRIILP